MMFLKGRTARCARAVGAYFGCALVMAPSFLLCIPVSRSSVRAQVLWQYQGCYSAKEYKYCLYIGVKYGRAQFVQWDKDPWNTFA